MSMLNTAVTFMVVVALVWILFGVKFTIGGIVGLTLFLIGLVFWGLVKWIILHVKWDKNTKPL